MRLSEQFSNKTFTEICPALQRRNALLCHFLLLLLLRHLISRDGNNTRKGIGMISQRVHQSLQQYSALHPIHACYKRQVLQLRFSLRGDFPNSVSEWLIRQSKSLSLHFRTYPEKWIYTLSYVRNTQISTSMNNFVLINMDYRVCFE